MAGKQNPPRLPPSDDGKFEDGTEEIEGLGVGASGISNSAGPQILRFEAAPSCIHAKSRTVGHARVHGEG